jgi:hypothetical protein
VLVLLLLGRRVVLLLSFLGSTSKSQHQVKGRLWNTKLDDIMELGPRMGEIAKSRQKVIRYDSIRYENDDSQNDIV